jgi:biotin carboxylase
MVGARFPGAFSQAPSGTAGQRESGAKPWESIARMGNRLMNVLMLRYSGYWAPSILSRADAVYLVVDSSPASRSLAPEVLARFARVYRISSYDSMEELSAVAADLTTTGVVIDKIASPNEHTQYAAGYLARLLGVDHFSEKIALNTRDKRLMRKKAAEAGLAVPRSCSMPDAGRGADLARVASEVGFPLVLKPAGGSGTSHTSLVRDAAELAALLADPDHQRAFAGRHLVAEEFVDGEEFHVDAVWRDGEPWTFFISRYFTPRLRLWNDGGLNGAVLLDESDHADLYDRVREIHRAFNARLGISRGTTHFEFFRERDGGRIVLGEIASRPGGCNIPEVIGAKCGVDERELWAHELLDGRPHELPFAPGRFAYTGWVNLIPEKSGTITQVPRREDLLRHPGVLAVGLMPQPGDEMHLHPATLGVLVTAGGDTEADVVRVAGELTRDFPVLTA